MKVTKTIFYKKRLSQVIKYGWKDSSLISKETHTNRLSVFFDILSCFHKYFLFSNQYKNNKIYSLYGIEKEELCTKLGNKNKQHDTWYTINYQDCQFLAKYNGFEWERTAEKIKERNEAYKKHFNLGKNCYVQYNVNFIREHQCTGTLTCGNKVLFARNVDIDLTGDLTIGDSVSLSEGCKILTHNHEMEFHKEGDSSKGCILTPLKIGDRVWFGARAVIMPGVKEIGRGAMVSTGAVVYKKIPPYAVVMGDPAKIVGFKWTPAEIIEYEQKTYSEEQRIPANTLYANYEKYVKSKLKEIKEFTRLSI